MSIAWRLAGAVRRTWWAAKWEQTKAMRRRCREKETATAPLLPPTPQDPAGDAGGAHLPRVRLRAAAGNARPDPCVRGNA